MDGKMRFFDEVGGLWEVFCGSRGLLETCLGDRGGLLWIRGGFYGLLRCLWYGFGCPWRPFGGCLGGFGWTLGSPGLANKIAPRAFQKHSWALFLETFMMFRVDFGQ